MIEQNDKISIITVTYNAEKFLEKTIQSVINQNYKNLEFLIIDGKSTDKTINIIKKYENQLTYWISEEDNGIYDAMNKGINKATGDWINFMNAGDMLSSNTILTEVFNKTYNCDVIYSDSFIINNKLEITKEFKAENLNYFLKAQMPFIHQSSFIRRDIMLNFPFRTDYKLASDYDLFFNLYHNGYKFEYLKNIKIANFLSGGMHTFNMVQYTAEATNSLLFTTSNKSSLENLEIVEIFKPFNNELKKFFPSVLSSLLLNVELIMNKYDRVILYGFGTLGKLLYSSYSNKIINIIDKSYSNKDLSLPIINLDEINKCNYQIVLISVLNKEKEIIKDLKNFGVLEKKIVFIDLEKL